MSILGGLMPKSLGHVTFINNFLASTGVLLSTLPSLLQNGNGTLGLLPTPVLPPFLGGSEALGQYPWGNRTANNTNYYEDVPNTGVTRYYDFTIHRAYLAPDGYNASFILINGQFPGPTLEANWGDMFEITVHNKLTDPEEGATLHWHGLLQKKTRMIPSSGRCLKARAKDVAAYYDGVPSVSQCPIAPGESFTYKFQADLYGTSWYHSHYSAQYAGGLFGPMVIYGPDNYPPEAGKVLDLGPIIVSDLYHEDYFSVVEQGSGPNPVASPLINSANTIIQGKGVTDCSNVPKNTSCTENAGLAKFNFTSGRTHRLRFINTSGQGFMIISLDGHNMTIIANDFVPVKPYTVTQVILHVGQRTDVLVTANQKPDAYWLRVRMPALCTLSTQPFALAAVYYDGVDTNKKPSTLPHLDFISPTLINCVNDPLSSTVPYYQITPAQPDVTQYIEITQRINSTGNTLYEMNGSSFKANYNIPLLNLTYNGNTSYPYDPQWNVYNFGKSNVQRLVFQNNVPFAHPMHVHGQNMYVLDVGVGKWDGKSMVNWQNPQRRDTQTLPPSGYLVVQLVADNPGVWPFHCHIAWHVSLGLYINVMQKPDQVNQTEIPAVMKQTCDAWNRYAQNNVPDEIDSGVKAIRNEKRRFLP